MPKFKNIAPGARGLRKKDGELVMIDAGKSASIEVDEAELRDAKASGFFEIGDGEAADANGAAEPGPLDGSIEDLEAHLAGNKDPDAIQALIDAETAGKSRKGALAALEARRDELLA